MGKYWKVVYISLAIILTVSTYYFQKAKANNIDVAIQIETIQGNDEEIEDIQLEGTYYKREIGHTFLLTKDGMSILSNNSFIQPLINPYGSSKFQKYVKDYRNFMRGVHNPYNILESDDRLIYVSIQEYGRTVIQGNPLTLQIDLLNKENKEKTTFEVNTPAEATYSWINIYDIYEEDGKINVLINGSLDGYRNEELRVITIDENNKQVVKDTLIAKAENKEDTVTSSIRGLFNTRSLQNNMYSVYLESNYSQTYNADDERDLISSKLIIYNNSTDEVKEWNLPDELQPYVDGMTIQESSLIIPVPTDDHLQLYRYDIEKEQWEIAMTWDVQNLEKEVEHLFSRQLDGKLYIMDHSNNNYTIVIGDLNTGELLYEGKITAKKNGEMASDSELSIYEIYKVEL